MTILPWVFIFLLCPSWSIIQQCGQLHVVWVCAEHWYFCVYDLMNCTLKYKSPIVLQNGRITDTSSAQARRGIDIQGIPWDRLSITREKYRQTRLEQYKNYENIPNSGELSLKVWDLLLYLVFMSILHRNSSQAQLVPLGIQTDQEGGIILRLLVQYKICQINHPSFSGQQRWDLVNMLAFCFYWPNTLFDSLKFWFIFHVRAILLK